MSVCRLNSCFTFSNFTQNTCIEICNLQWKHQQQVPQIRLGNHVSLKLPGPQLEERLPLAPEEDNRGVEAWESFYAWMWSIGKSPWVVRALVLQSMSSSWLLLYFVFIAHVSPPLSLYLYLSLPFNLWQLLLPLASTPQVERASSALELVEADDTCRAFASSSCEVRGWWLD